MFGNSISLAPLKARVPRRKPVPLRHGNGGHHWADRRLRLGIEVRGASLYLACVRTGLRRRWLAATGVIDDFAQLTAAELKQKLADFLRPVSAEAPLVVLGVPRSDAIVRHLRVPVAAAKTLGQAIALQIDMSKPSDEDEFCWDAARVYQPAQIAVSLVLVPSRIVKDLAARLAEAGYAPAQLTVAQFSLLQMVSSSPVAAEAKRLVVVDANARTLEIALLQDGAAVYSRALDIDPAQADSEVPIHIGQALAGLRWDESQPLTIVLAGASPALEQALASLGSVRRLQDFYPTAGFDRDDSGQFWTAAALALDGAGWFARYRLNLLPPELRPARNVWKYAPRYALAGIYVVLALALLLRAPVQERLLLRRYARESAALKARAAQVERHIEQEKQLRRRILLLQEFQQRGRAPLDAASEVAQKLPPEAWLNLFNCQQGQIEIAGTAKSASALLPALKASSTLDDVRFNGALTRETSGLERFRLQMRLRSN